MKSINCGLLSILVMEPEIWVYVVLRMEKGHQRSSSWQPKVGPFEKFVYKIKYRFPLYCRVPGDEHLKPHRNQKFGL